MHPLYIKDSESFMEEVNLPQEQFEEKKVLDELKVSYLNYAMSVIVARALPDVRDGLKPS